MNNLIPLNRHSSFKSLSRVSTARYRSPSLLVDQSVTVVSTISGSPRLKGIKVSHQALKGYRAAAFHVSVFGSLPGANGPVMVESVRTLVRRSSQCDKFISQTQKDFAPRL